MTSRVGKLRGWIFMMTSKLAMVQETKKRCGWGRSLFVEQCAILHMLLQRGFPRTLPVHGRGDVMPISYENVCDYGHDDACQPTMPPLDIPTRVIDTQLQCLRVFSPKKIQNVPLSL